MTSNKTEKEINIKNNMDKKIIYSNCEPCTPIIIKRYTNHKNILFNSVNNFNFNNFSLSTFKQSNSFKSPVK